MKKMYGSKKMTMELEWELFNGRDGAIAKITGAELKNVMLPSKEEYIYEAEIVDNRGIHAFENRYIKDTAIYEIGIYRTTDTEEKKVIFIQAVMS